MYHFTSFLIPSHVQFFLFFTKSPLYPGALLACGRDFLSVSPQSCLVGLFFFLRIAIGRSFFPTWRRCNGVVALALCLFKCHILKEYWLWFERLGIVFFSC